MRLKKGDLVEVMAGKDRGKRGKVLKIYTKGNRILIQGVNVLKKHLKQRSQDVPGGIVEMESPVQYSNTMLVCNKCGRGVRIGVKILEDGTKMRICKRCKEPV